MSKIDFNTYLKKVNACEYHFYDCPSEICYFPFTNEEIDMKWLSTELNNFGEYLNHEESFEERKDIAENNKEWKDFVQELKKERHYVCELSGFNTKKIKELNYELFHIDGKHTWINSWLVAHHIDDKSEYECYNKNKLVILNRAVHLIKHRYNNLIEYVPNLKNNYELWFELGCLIHDRNNEYPWRNIREKKVW